MKKIDRDWIILFYTFAVTVLTLLPAMPVMAQTHSHPAEPVKSSVMQQNQPAVQPEQEIPLVELSSDQQKLIGVKTVKAAVIPMTKIIRTVGRVEVDESRQATINAKTEGWIEKLYVNTTGSYISQGQKIAEIYSPELLATELEFLTALKWTQNEMTGKSGAGEARVPASDLNKMISQDAAATLEAARQRLLLWDMSPGQISDIEKTGKPSRTMTLYAPVSGYVTQKMVVAGMKIMPGEKLLDIADLSSLWIVADIYEYELPLVKVGNQATVTLAYLPGVELMSKIDYIYPELSAQTRTAKVRLKLSNSKYRLKPQMFTNVELKISLGKKLAVPESAILNTGKATVVYVDTGHDAFEPREVKTGIGADGYVEVLSGLRSGEKVVNAANFLIDSEAQLKGIKPLPSR